MYVPTAVTVRTSENSVHVVFMFVVPHKKYRLLPYTALTSWSFNGDGMCSIGGRKQCL
jgi:hypothetical protein